MKRIALSQSNGWNHWGCLRDGELRIGKQQSRFVFYQLSDPRIETLLSLVDDRLTDVACGVQDCTRSILPEEPTL